jgi:hypothetical protein
MTELSNYFYCFKFMELISPVLVYVSHLTNPAIFHDINVDDIIPISGPGPMIYYKL